MDDIIFSVPEACGDPECPVQFHMEHYWYYPDTDTYSVCDNDGSHTDVDRADLPDADEQDRRWDEYWRYVAKTGYDPCHQLVNVKTTREVRTRWQIKISTWIGVAKYGLRVVGARRNCRGPFMAVPEFPQELRDYLELTPNRCIPFKSREELKAVGIDVKRTAAKYDMFETTLTTQVAIADRSIAAQTRQEAKRIINERESKPRRRRNVRRRT